MGQVIAAVVTLGFLAGFGVVILRMPIATARRVWLAAFVLVLGSGVTMMAAHSFVSKWAFKGDSPRDGLVSMMEGTAWRPFVYRRLAPDIVRSGTDVLLRRLPPNAINYLYAESPLRRYKGDWQGIEDWTPRKAVAFHLAYAVVWASLFGALLAMAALIQALRRCSWFEAAVTSSLTMCLAPLMWVGGGYLYDGPELLLWTLTLLTVVRSWVFATPLVFALMLYNKESALITVPALFPLFQARLGRNRAAAWTAVLGAMGLAWVIYVRRKYAANDGEPTEWWLPMNLQFWLNPGSYLKFAQLFSPALLSPRGLNVLSLLFFVLPFRFGWQRTGKDVRWATIATAGVLIPLFLTSCYRDEMRNLILLFPLLQLVCIEGVHEMFRLATPTAIDAAADRRVM